MIKQGTFTVTAAEASGGKNLELGFEPDYFKLFNFNATTDEVLFTEKFKTMADLDSVDTFSSNAGGAVISPLLDTSAGLSAYNTGSIAEASSQVSDSGFAGITIPAARLTEADVYHYLALSEEGN